MFFLGKIFFDSAVWSFIHAGLVAIPKESDLYTVFWFRLRRVRGTRRSLGRFGRGRNGLVA